jgi:hypothetical protein
MTRTSVMVEVRGLLYHHKGAGPWKVQLQGREFAVVNERGENALAVAGIKTKGSYTFFAQTAAQAIADALTTGAAAGAPPSSFYGPRA